MHTHGLSFPPSRGGTARSRPSGATRALLLCGALALACAHGRDFVWVYELPVPPKPEAGYHIVKGDVLSVRVWNQESMSVARVRVREDGMISVPFLQDVDVDGLTPSELSRRLQTRLKPFIVSPVVTVVVEETGTVRISVIGEVVRPGTVEVPRAASVLDALAAAGGLTEYAHKDRVFVLRPDYWADGDPAPGRIRFRYSSLAQGKTPDVLFHLRPGDIVVAE